jgi:hypothetical protein
MGSFQALRDFTEILLPNDPISCSRPAIGVPALWPIRYKNGAGWRVLFHLDGNDIRIDYIHSGSGFATASVSDSVDQMKKELGI